MNLDDVDDLVVGLVAGLILDQIRAKSRAILLAIAVVGVLAIVGIAAAPTWGKVLCALALVAAIAAAIFTLVARRAFVAMLDRGIDHSDLADHRAALDRAIEDLAVPSGPASMAKMAWRLRRGTGAEVDRIRDVALRLQRELDLT